MAETLLTPPAAPAAETGAVHSTGGDAAPPEQQAGEVTPPATEQPKTPEGTTQPDATTEPPKPADPPAIEVKLPDGVEADPTILEALKDAAKDSASAQKLADAYLAAQKASEEKADAAWQQTQQKWVEGLKADPEFGGTRFDENVGHARRALDRFGGKDLQDLLERSGFGNHPAVVRTFSAIGKAFAEDRIAQTVATPPVARTEDDIYRAMYPQLFQKKE